MIYPEYNPVDNAKRAIKKIIDESNKSNDWKISKSSLINILTSRFDENSHSDYMFLKEEVDKAFDELSSEINFTKFFQNRAVEKLKDIDSYKHGSKDTYEKDLAQLGFTKEEIDNALKLTLHIMLSKKPLPAAQQQAVNAHPQKKALYETW